MEKIKWSLDKFVEKQRISGEGGKASSRMSSTVSYDEILMDVDLAIETVPEKLDLKEEVSTRMDEISPKARDGND